MHSVMPAGLPGRLANLILAGVTKPGAMSEANTAKEAHVVTGSKHNVTLNSAILYVLGFLLTTILHEFGHAFAGVLAGSRPVLHHHYVEHLATSHLTTANQALIALAGPVVSLLQGVVAGMAFHKQAARRRGLLSLLLLWFMVLGMFNFLGYLMTGPLFSEGDVGHVYALLGTPLWMQIALAIAGAAGVVFVAYKLTAPFLMFSYRHDWVATEKARVNFSLHVLLLPWIAGALIVTLCYSPVVAVVSIIYPFTSGMVFIFPWQNARNIKEVPLANDHAVGQRSWRLVGLLCALLIVFRFVLAPGIAF